MIMFSFEKKQGHAFSDVNVLVFYTLTSMWFNTAICMNTTSYFNAFNATSVNFIKGPYLSSDIGSHNLETSIGYQPKSKSTRTLHVFLPSLTPSYTLSSSSQETLITMQAKLISLPMKISTTTIQESVFSSFDLHRFQTPSMNRSRKNLSRFLSSYKSILASESVLSLTESRMTKAIFMTSHIRPSDVQNIHSNTIVSISQSLNERSNLLVRSISIYSNSLDKSNISKMQKPESLTTSNFFQEVSKVEIYTQSLGLSSSEMTFMRHMTPNDILMHLTTVSETFLSKNSLMPTTFRNKILKTSSKLITTTRNTPLLFSSFFRKNSSVLNKLHNLKNNFVRTMDTLLATMFATSIFLNNTSSLTRSKKVSSVNFSTWSIIPGRMDETTFQKLLPNISESIMEINSAEKETASKLSQVQRTTVTLARISAKSISQNVRIFPSTALRKITFSLHARRSFLISQISTMFLSSKTSTVDGSITLLQTFTSSNAGNLTFRPSQSNDNVFLSTSNIINLAAMLLSQKRIFFRTSEINSKFATINTSSSMPKNILSPPFTPSISLPSSSTNSFVSFTKHNRRSIMANTTYGEASRDTSSVNENEIILKSITNKHPISSIARSLRALDISNSSTSQKITISLNTPKLIVSSPDAYITTQLGRKISNLSSLSSESSDITATSLMKTKLPLHSLSSLITRLRFTAKFKSTGVLNTFKIQTSSPSSSHLLSYKRKSTIMKWESTKFISLITYPNATDETKMRERQFTPTIYKEPISSDSRVYMTSSFITRGSLFPLESSTLYVSSKVSSQLNFSFLSQNLPSIHSSLTLQLLALSSSIISKSGLKKSLDVTSRLSKYSALNLTKTSRTFLPISMPTVMSSGSNSSRTSSTKHSRGSTVNKKLSGFSAFSDESTRSTSSLHISGVNSLFRSSLEKGNALTAKTQCISPSKTLAMSKSLILHRVLVSSSAANIKTNLINKTSSLSKKMADENVKSTASTPNTEGFLLSYLSHRSSIRSKNTPLNINRTSFAQRLPFFLSKTISTTVKTRKSSLIHATYSVEVASTLPLKKSVVRLVTSVISIKSISTYSTHFTVSNFDDKRSSRAFEAYISAVSNMLSQHSSFSSSSFSSSVTSSDVQISRTSLNIFFNSSLRFTVRVFLLIPTTVNTQDIMFLRDLRSKLERLYNLGDLKGFSSRKRRNTLQDVRSGEFKTINNDAGQRLRLKRQNETRFRVELLNVTRSPASEQVEVRFCVKNWSLLIPAVEAARTMNIPSLAEAVSILGYQVSGKFSAILISLDERNKNNEVVLVIVSVSVPVVLVFLACLVIKRWKKRRTSHKLKLNKVSIERNKDELERVIPDRKHETLPTSTSPTLPTKDYPDVIVQTPDTKKQRRKIVKLIEVQEIEKQISPSIVSHPAATFENITYVNFDGTSSFAVSEVALRLRPTIRKEIDSDVKTNAIPNHSLAGKNKNITQRNDTLIQSIEPSLKDKLMKKKQISESESDDTIQIKANIEKWREKLRQRRKKKENTKSAKNKYLKQRRRQFDSLISLEEKKLSRREWLMAQLEIQAILEGKDVNKQLEKVSWTSDTELKPEAEKYVESETDNEVLFFPIKRRRMRLPQKSSRRVAPFYDDNVPMIALTRKQKRFDTDNLPGESTFQEADTSRPPNKLTVDNRHGNTYYDSLDETDLYEQFYSPDKPNYAHRGYYTLPTDKHKFPSVKHYKPLQTETSFTSGEPFLIPRREPINSRRPPANSYVTNHQQIQKLNEDLGDSANSVGTKLSNRIYNVVTNNENSKEVEAPLAEKGAGVTKNTENTHGHSLSNVNELQNTLMDAKTDDDFSNYSLNEKQARSLVTRALSQANTKKI
ncbi:mucin-3A-like isoform X2 [Xenia sp. Carnegie-2017]|uniref:mucin-3A-like isoform X2 n=1 Tax=Xenia sp. Carnegie-2017 TaxID=2897299 RepID=UPI001F046ADC|nr:mucin-3A-like isoform X2 [Xenia sp. Carnegie-2017]